MYYFHGLINIIPLQYDNRLYVNNCPLSSCMRIHILGVAGTFMSGIAILAKRSQDVTGSDTSCYDPIKSLLQKEKIDIIKIIK